MRQNIADGLQTTAVPSNLRPTIATADKDRPPSSFDGCHIDFPALTQKRACVYGDPNGTHTVLLFGDSHIEQWLPAITIAAQNLHWRVVNLTKAACPVASLTIYSPVLKRPYSECDQWRATTVARITTRRNLTKHY